MRNNGYMNDDPKNVVKDIVALVGKHKAVLLLMGEDVSASTSEKLVGGRYESEIGQLVRKAILRAHEAAQAIAAAS
jgi:hypothetical protein